MTQEEFDQLPLLMRSSEAMRALGVSKNQFRLIVLARPEIASDVPGQRHRKYRKSEIAKIAGVEYR